MIVVSAPVGVVLNENEPAPTLGGVTRASVTVLMGAVLPGGTKPTRLIPFVDCRLELSRGCH